MSNKQRFSLLLRPDEHTVLQQLAEIFDRSSGATLRLLIRQEGQKHNLWPSVPPIPPKESSRERQPA